MDTSSWRIRVMLEPRGFIRFLEFILAIVSFATTSGYSGTFSFPIKCNDTTSKFPTQFGYPFKLDDVIVKFKFCNATQGSVHLNGDFSPPAQWFVFVGVTAFLVSLASIIFYVVYDSKVRAAHERIVTVGDLVLTVVYAFFWLTAASAWAWGLNEVRLWTSFEEIQKIEDLKKACNDDNASRCNPSEFIPANFVSLTASVTFGFLNFFLWLCNVWFVYKETPFHQEPGRNADNGGMQDSSIPPNNM